MTVIPDLRRQRLGGSWFEVAWAKKLVILHSQAIVLGHCGVHLLSQLSGSINRRTTVLAGPGKNARHYSQK
jgi:hypothetical protein